MIGWIVGPIIGAVAGILAYSYFLRASIDRWKDSERLAWAESYRQNVKPLQDDLERWARGDLILYSEGRHRKWIPTSWATIPIVSVDDDPESIFHGKREENE